MSKSQSPCFISDSRTCPASRLRDMAFIIGSGSSEFKEDIEVIKEVLNNYGLEGYFAPFSEKEIGLEIFCNKICLKIRESQFCVALLNNPIIKIDKRASNSSKELRTPSANVYFEFGMAIALEKSVIPIIRRDLELPFDVQNLDTIMYGDSSDLRKKLTSSLPAVLSKKKKEIRTTDLKLVEKILEPLSSILQKHIVELGTFGFISTYEITDILEKEAYYAARIPSDLLERLKKYLYQVEAWHKIEYYAKKAITNIVNEAILKYLNKPVTLIEDLYRIEIRAISNSGNNIQLQTQEIFRLLIDNQKIKEFLREIHWRDVYERIAIRYSNEPSIEMKMEEFNEKIWNKCVDRVSSNPKILGYKKNTKSIRQEAKDILEEITKD